MVGITFLKPLWKFAYKKFQVNPVDIVLFLSDINKVKKIDEWKKLLKNFEKDSSSEWFDSREDLAAYYEKSDFLEDKEFDHFFEI